MALAKQRDYPNVFSRCVLQMRSPEDGFSGRDSDIGKSKVTLLLVSLQELLSMSSMSTFSPGEVLVRGGEHPTFALVIVQVRGVVRGIRQEEGRHLWI